MSAAADRPCTAACYRSKSSAAGCKCKCGGKLHGGGAPDGNGRYTVERTGTYVAGGYDHASKVSGTPVYSVRDNATGEWADPQEEDIHAGDTGAQARQGQAEALNQDFDQSLGPRGATPERLTRSVASAYWGAPDSQLKLADGIYEYKTPGHGGIVVDMDRANLSHAAVTAAERTGRVEEVVVYAPAGRKTKVYCSSEYKITQEMRDHPDTSVHRVWAAEEDTEADAVLAVHKDAREKWAKSRGGYPPGGPDALGHDCRSAMCQRPDQQAFAAHYLAARGADTQLTYAKPGEGGVRQLRRVRPVSARESKDGRAYVVAHDFDRGEVRSFRIDRIEEFS